MKLKKLAVATALAISTSPMLAQNFEGTTPDERIAATNNDNEDSIKIGRQIRVPRDAVVDFLQGRMKSI